MNILLQQIFLTFVVIIRVLCYFLVDSFTFSPDSSILSPAFSIVLSIFFPARSAGPSFLQAVKETIIIQLQKIQKDFP